MTGSVLPGQVAFHSISKTITVGLQTRFLCIPKKPCLRCKEALFGRQRSLVFNAGVIFLVFRLLWIRVDGGDMESKRGLPLSQASPFMVVILLSVPPDSGRFRTLRCVSLRR